MEKLETKKQDQLTEVITSSMETAATLLDREKQVKLLELQVKEIKNFSTQNQQKFC